VVATNSASDINALILLFQLVHQGPKRLIRAQSAAQNSANSLFESTFPGQLVPHYFQDSFTAIILINQPERSECFRTRAINGSEDQRFKWQSPAHPLLSRLKYHRQRIQARTISRLHAHSIQALSWDLPAVQSIPLQDD